MAYTTAEIDANVTKLQAHMSKGYVEVSHDGRRLVYRTVDEILKAIGYFESIRSSASDAATATVDRRTFYLFGGGGR